MAGASHFTGRETLQFFKSALYEHDLARAVRVRAPRVGRSQAANRESRNCCLISW
jgi:hypothetical protein